MCGAVVHGPGCASYSPSLVKLDPSGSTAAKHEDGSLCVYLEEYATSEKCKTAFDTDLIKEGVLALLVNVRNSSTESYETKPMDIVLRECETVMKTLTPEEAAKKAKRDAGWSMIVPIISIPVAVVASATHTSKVNKQILHDFTAKAFTGGMITPHRECSGFLFFELPKGRTDLAGLTLVLTARKESTGEPKTIATELPPATFKPVVYTVEE